MSVFRCTLGRASRCRTNPAVIVRQPDALPSRSLFTNLRVAQLRYKVIAQVLPLGGRGHSAVGLPMFQLHTAVSKAPHASTRPTLSRAALWPCKVAA